MKKKVLSLCMAAALVLGSGTAAMAADTLESNGDTAIYEVKGKYEKMAEPAKVYKVDVQWGSMEFTYKDGDTHRTWDPKTHEYADTINVGQWTNKPDANKVTITNSSNAAVTASIKVKMGTDSAGITAKPAAESLNLGDASIGADTTTPGTAIKASTTISLEGELTNKKADKQVIGNVVVTIFDSVQP